MCIINWSVSEISWCIVRYRSVSCIATYVSQYVSYRGSANRYTPNNGLAPARRQGIIWTNDGLVYWRIYASLGHSELKPQ